MQITIILKFKQLKASLKNKIPFILNFCNRKLEDSSSSFLHFKRARIDHYNAVFSSIFVKNNRLTSQEHFARIRKVLDYIDQHLDDELPLEKLAEMGNYSAFHFHRIFHLLPPYLHIASHIIFISPPLPTWYWLS